MICFEEILAPNWHSPFNKIGRIQRKLKRRSFFFVDPMLINHKFLYHLKSFQIPLVVEAPELGKYWTILKTRLFLCIEMRRW